MLTSAALASVKMLGASGHLRRKLASKVTALKDRLRAGGFTLPDHPGPIIPAIPRDARETESLKRRLLAARIHPPFIKYPGGPPDGFFRFAISSEHTAKQLDALAEVLLSFAPKSRPPAANPSVTPVSRESP
jgi:7-keto-8-aminopelargonate synthetase-like enzyme